MFYSMLHAHQQGFTPGSVTTLPQSNGGPATLPPAPIVPSPAAPHSIQPPYGTRPASKEPLGQVTHLSENGQ